MKKYLLRLVGGGDIDFSEVGEATWNWINSPAPNFGKKSSVNEPVPADVKAEAFDPAKVPYKVLITCGSYDNDRALHASCWSKSINESRGFKQYFEDTYDGMIY